MPLPERMKTTRVSLSTVNTLADKAEEILSKIDQGAGEEDDELQMMMAEWNSQVVNPYAFSDFRDYLSWASAKDFTQMAFNQERIFDDFLWKELIQIINFLRNTEGSESDQSYALALLEINFDANPSDLIYWPDAWFQDTEMLHVELTAEEIAGYLMAKSGRHLSDAPAIELKYSIPINTLE
ncbi:MAG: hypothetical protein ACMZI0_10670 [Symbiopectobacterium sp.]|uniref:hypothetical protein n=1 Tax=Symbiopectobacterium sp. TaxID=2952789 RepID=UPI0039ED753C